MGDYRDCMAAIEDTSDEVICEGEFPAECDALFSEDCLEAE